MQGAGARLCAQRGRRPTTVGATPSLASSGSARTRRRGRVRAARCRTKAAIRRPCPNCAADEGDLRDEDWDLLARALALAAVEEVVPEGMMRGIEGVAHRLARDMSEGRASLESLDLEAIGKDVFDGVDPSDVEALAGRLHELVPALDHALARAPTRRGRRRR